MLQVFRFQHVTGFVLAASLGLGGANPVFGLDFPCLWGGKNEETTYAAPYLPVMGTGSARTDAPHPGVNRNAPRDSIPVQNTPYGTIHVPQERMSGQPADGAVGTVNQPATVPMPLTNNGSQTIYVIPERGEPDPLRPNSCVAVASEVVPAGTPGAVPVNVQQRTVLKPESEWSWTFDWTTNVQLRRVDVINPRTGRVIRSYYRQEEVRSLLPWLHQKETVHFRPTTVPVATPVNNRQYQQTAASPASYNNTFNNSTGNSAVSTTRID